MQNKHKENIYVQGLSAFRNQQQRFGHTSYPQSIHKWKREGKKVSIIATHHRTKVEMPEMLLYLPAELTGNKEPQNSTLLSQ